MSVLLAIIVLSGLVASADAQTFTRITTGAFVNDGTYSEGVSWDDVNGDGNLDFVVGNILNQNNLLFLGNGDGTFTPDLTSPVATDGGFSYGGVLAVFFTPMGTTPRPDLFLANGGSSSNQSNFFYTNDGTGTFTKVTTEILVNDPSGSWSSSAADYDNDGDLDIFVANFNQNNALYRNEGDAVFVEITIGDIVSDGGASLGSGWADYDDDSDMDLVVANANFGAGQNNFLYENDGNGTFTRVLTSPIATDGGNSVGVSWGDHDGDLDLDLYITNYFGEGNFLYRNEGGGTFARIVTGAPVTDGGSSVGATWGDTDNDGDLDLFVSNDLDEDNFFYENDGDGTFTAITTGDIVSNGGRSNGSAWADVDHDGDLDLYVTNGDSPVSQSNFFYRNEGTANHWIQIRCTGIVGNPSAIGARVEALATIEGIPTWQAAEISSQTGYNAANSFIVEFGLGNATVVDTLRITWPWPCWGDIQQIELGLSADTLHEVLEDAVIDATPEAVTPSPVTRVSVRPNPAGSTTTLRYELTRPGRVRLSLFDARGRRVAILIDDDRPAGPHAVDVQADRYPSGIYTYELRSGGHVERGKLTVVR